MRNRNRIVLAAGLALLVGACGTAPAEDDGFIPVQSTVFDAVKYDEADGKLTLRWLDGREITHNHVPGDLYDRFMETRTKGGFYRGLIELDYPTEGMMKPATQPAGEGEEEAAGEGAPAEKAGAEAQAPVAEPAAPAPEAAPAEAPPVEEAAPAPTEPSAAPAPAAADEAVPRKAARADQPMPADTPPAAEEAMDDIVDEPVGMGRADQPMQVGAEQAAEPAEPEAPAMEEETDVEAALEEAVDEETMPAEAVSDEEPMTEQPAEPMAEDEVAVIEDPDEEAELDALLGEFDEEPAMEETAPEEPATEEPPVQEPSPAASPKLRVPSRVPVVVDEPAQPEAAADEDLEELLGDMQ